MLSLVRIATAVIGAVGLAFIVLSAQDDLNTARQAAEQGDADAQYNLGVIPKDTNNGEGSTSGLCRPSRRTMPKPCAGTG